MMNGKIVKRSALLLLVAISIYACAQRTGDVPEILPETDGREGLLLSPVGETIPLVDISPGRAPEPVRTWIEGCRQLFARPFTDTFEHEGYTYIFVARGERPTGGYDVSIREARRTEGDTIEVRVTFTRPAPDMMVTQAITYPFDVAAIPHTGVAIRILPDGNDRPVPLTRLRGTDRMPAIVAQSDVIKVFVPKPGEHVEGSVRLAGIAMLSEAILYYRLASEAGDVYTIGSTPTAVPFEWGYFETMVQLPDGIDDTVYLILYRYDQSESAESDHVRIPLHIVR
jgi:hypothetical protein